MVYVPIAVHEPLKASQDDVFFKMCRMRGIAFDVKNKVGTLFLLVDKIVSGAVSVLCIADSRKKAFDLAIHSMNFIVQQFGKDTAEVDRKCDNLNAILVNLRKVLKEDNASH